METTDLTGIPTKTIMGPINYRPLKQLGSPGLIVEPPKHRTGIARIRLATPAQLKVVDKLLNPGGMELPDAAYEGPGLAEDPRYGKPCGASCVTVVDECYIPNPVSFYLHKSPEIVHMIETLGNHFIELVAPWLMLVPLRCCRLFAGFVQIFFQVVLIMSGNLSFLNWLTILPSICFLDDLFLSRMFSTKSIKEASKMNTLLLYSNYHRITNKIYKIVHFLLLSLIAYLSIPIVSNLLSSRQLMNSSFDNFRLVNTYGAFGSVTKTRTEIIILGTASDYPNAPQTEWFEYEFNCKPGKLNRRPCLISPYHYRLDWLMWFAAFQNYQQNPWLIHLAAKFLMNDTESLGLISENPFKEQPPNFIRMDHYLYNYADMTNENGVWWNRKYIGEYMPVVSLKELEPILKRQQWPINPKTPTEKKMFHKKKTKSEL
ncbi:lipase maturation factor 1-like [Symsagittifera roscoffensis]|uniref:lipase maturation factor 1-like n=1 Tax=Symsagittifera roscoffensis TaxID=84072 RepID=UPI00307B962D